MIHMCAFRDTFVTTRPYIQIMKTFLLVAAVLSFSPLAFGQSMMRSAASVGRKVVYTDLEAAKALAAEGPTVLFFAADWCPYCQADLKDINANGSRLGGVTIVVVDYDKERELEKLYAVTAQDTFVQIDSRGARLVAWNGGGVDGILSHVKRG